MDLCLMRWHNFYSWRLWDTSNPEPELGCSSQHFLLTWIIGHGSIKRHPWGFSVFQIFSLLPLCDNSNTISPWLSGLITLARQEHPLLCGTGHPGWPGSSQNLHFSGIIVRSPGRHSSLWSKELKTSRACASQGRGRTVCQWTTRGKWIVPLPSSLLFLGIQEYRLWEKQYPMLDADSKHTQHPESPCPALEGVASCHWAGTLSMSSQEHSLPLELLRDAGECSKNECQEPGPIASLHFLRSEFLGGKQCHVECHSSR